MATNPVTPATEPFPFAFKVDIFHVWFNREKGKNHTNAELERLTLGVIGPVFSLPIRWSFNAGVEKARVQLQQANVAGSLDLDLVAHSNPSLFLNGQMAFYLLARYPLPGLVQNHYFALYVFGHGETTVWPNNFKNYSVVLEDGNTRIDFSALTNRYVQGGNYTLWRWSGDIILEFSKPDSPWIIPFGSFGLSGLTSSLFLEYTPAGEDFLDGKNVNKELASGEFSFDDQFFSYSAGFRLLLGEGGVLNVEGRLLKDDDTTVTSLLVSTWTYF